jgi:hypothetical protein
METARKDLAGVVKRVVEREGEKARREEEEKMGEVGRMVRRRRGVPGTCGPGGLHSLNSVLGTCGSTAHCENLKTLRFAKLCDTVQLLYSYSIVH